MKKFISAILMCLLTASTILFNGCGELNSDKVSNSDVFSKVSEIETKAELPPQIAEMVGIYSVNDFRVQNLEIKESDLSVCKTVEVTEDGKIICKGLVDDKEFELAYDQTNTYNNMYIIYTEESSDAGFSYAGINVIATEYILDEAYEGPTLIDYIYDDSESFPKGTMHIYIKFKDSTDAWDGYLDCSKLD